MKKSIFLILIVLIIDQTLKIWIKTGMTLNEEIPVFSDWFYIHFTENKGMAFGMELPGKYGKYILSIFRLFAIGGIAWYLKSLINQKANFGLISSISLILAGAIGNIIDSLFYGIIFNSSTSFSTAQFLPEEGGYSGFLLGKVVDMFYFPIIEGYIPDWSPIWAGDYFIFFRPIFNIADTSITIGVLMILLFQRKYFKSK